MDGGLRLQEKLLIIDQIPLFANLSANNKKEIAYSSSIVEYKRGDLIYRESEPPCALYCVVSGRLRAYIIRDGREENLEYFTRGKYFGTVSILTGEPHSVTAQAVNDSIILKIPKDFFEKILRRIPQLAIHFSQTLSKALRLRQMRKKGIFESLIISVVGSSDKIGATCYVLNLGISLKVQTNKKIAIISINTSIENILAVSGLKVNTKPLRPDSPYFSEEVVRSATFVNRLGVDMINVALNAGELQNLISLVSYLTNDYHYVLIDLSNNVDEASFELLKQSDAIHLISASDEASLRLTAKLISDLGTSSPDMASKLKVITSEYGARPALDFGERRAVLDRDIFATLPDMNKAGYVIDASRVPILTEYPDSEYAKVVRRVSRQIGNCMVGIALGSGAALGLAYVGILKVIERENILIDMVAGTSMGALIGALWAMGRNAFEIEEIIYGFKKKISSLRLIDLTIPKMGLIKGREVKRFLVSKFGNKTFYDLRLPLKIVACDIEKREEVILSKGSLADAVMASVAIPGMFEPVRISDSLLVDGGIINPLPTNVLTRNGVAKIIAVNALPSPADIQQSKKKVANIFDIIVNSIQASEYLLAEMSCQNADIVMHPILPTADWYELYEGEQIIKRGEEEALRYLPRLKELAYGN